MQEVTPRVVAMAVRMLMISWMMNLMVSFFMGNKVLVVKHDVRGGASMRER